MCCCRQTHGSINYRVLRELKNGGEDRRRMPCSLNAIKVNNLLEKALDLLLSAGNSLMTLVMVEIKIQLSFADSYANRLLNKAFSSRFRPVKFDRKHNFHNLFTRSLFLLFFISCSSEKKIYIC